MAAPADWATPTLSSDLNRFRPSRDGDGASASRERGGGHAMATPGAVVATLLIGASGSWLGAALSRVVAVVVYGPDAWRHGVWATFAGAAGLFAAHRMGGTTSRDAWLVVVASLLAALGATLGGAPSLVIPQLVHPIVIAVGWDLVGLAVGIVGGVALRRAGVLSPLAIGAAAAGSAAALATAPSLTEVVGAPGLAFVAAAGVGAASLTLAVTERSPRAQPLESREAPTPNPPRLRRAWGEFASATTIMLIAACAVPIGAAFAAPLVASLPGTVADPGRVPVAKSLFASVASKDDDERHVSAMWGAAGRFDVTVAPNGARWLYLDGVPYGVVAPQGRIRPDGALLPFVLPGNSGTVGRVLVIGLGGGQEVRAALEAGASTVVVAEPHPGALETVRAAQAAAGGPPIFDSDAVRVVGEEARSWLRSSDARFDLILVTLASFGAAAEPGRPSGSMLLTREAIVEYMDHLDTDGTLAIRVRDDHELWRTFNTAFQAMADAGAPSPTDAIRHLLAVNDGTAGGTLEDITLPTVFVRKAPYTQTIANDVLHFLLEAPFPPLFVPYSESRSVLAIIGTEDGPATAEAGVPYDIGPARDDRPYFQEAGKGLPWAAIGILLALASGTAVAAWASGFRPNDFGDLARDHDPDELGNIDRRPAPTDAAPWRHVLIAALGGMASGTIGTAMLWRLPLIAGRADVTNAAGGAALAVGALAAAFVVHRTARLGVRAIAGWGALLAAALPFIIREALPLGSSLIHGQSFAVRVLIGAALLVPIGFGVGAQLPALLRLLSLTRRHGWEGLVWGTSVASSAVGVAIAQVASRVSGDTLTTVIGAGAALGCFLAFGLRWVSESDARDGGP